MSQVYKPTIDKLTYHSIGEAHHRISSKSAAAWPKITGATASGGLAPTINTWLDLHKVGWNFLPRCIDCSWSYSSVITVYAQLSTQILYSYLRVRNATSYVLKQGNTSFGHFMKRNKKQWQELYNSSRNDWRNIPRTTSLISCRMYLSIMPTCSYCYLLYNCSHRRSCLVSRRSPPLVWTLQR